MKTDSLFYRLFLEFPQFFFELIGRSPEVASGYQFTSIEVNQARSRCSLFSSMDSRSHRA
jgi:predicted transposase YdaD